MVIAVAVAAGCAEGGTGTVQPRDGRAGLQLSGTIDGRQLALSDGQPQLVVGDCDPQDGADEDVCAIARDIDGTPVLVVFENPAVLRVGAVLEVGTGGCTRPTDCTHVRDVAVVAVQVGDGRRHLATGGELRLTVVEPATRYAGRLRLRLPGGTLSGQFDLVPRPE